MGWSVPTYSGTYMLSNVRTAMFELCRGVNERQGAVGITKTQFRKATGALASDLTMADLLGMFGTGSNALDNLTRVRDAIIAMANSGKFTTTSGGTTAWTKATLETAIGEDLDAAPIRLQEARFWQAMQDALDKLVFGKLSFSFSGFSASAQRRIGSGASKQAAWTAAIGATPTSVTDKTATWVNFSLSATIIDNVVVGFDLSAFTGDVVAGDFLIQGFNGSDIDIDWTIGSVTGVTVENASGGGTTYNAQHTWVDTHPTGAVLYIPVTIDTTVPGTTPFVTLSSTVTIQITSAVFFTDLASILTDQA